MKPTLRVIAGRPAQRQNYAPHGYTQLAESPATAADDFLTGIAKLLGAAFVAFCLLAGMAILLLSLGA
jgi:hypothetical protein